MFIAVLTGVIVMLAMMLIEIVAAAVQRRRPQLGLILSLGATAVLYFIAVAYASETY